MKNLIALAGLLIGTQSFATTGTDLINALNAAIDEATVEFDIQTVEAFEVTPESADEVLVAFKTLAEVHEYGCHYHGQSMACHAEDDHHDDHKSAADFDHMIEGYDAALDKLRDTFSRSGRDLSILKSMKVWILEEDSTDPHAHGADVWTKVTYDQGNSERTVFVQCHEHDDHDHKSGELACHYKRSGKDEPTL